MIPQLLVLPSEIRNAGGRAGFTAKICRFRVGLVTFEIYLGEVNPEERSGLEIEVMVSYNSEL